MIRQLSREDKNNHRENAKTRVSDLFYQFVKLRNRKNTRSDLRLWRGYKLRTFSTMVYLCAGGRTKSWIMCISYDDRPFFKILKLRTMIKRERGRLLRPTGPVFDYSGLISDNFLSFPRVGCNGALRNDGSGTDMAGLECTVGLVHYYKLLKMVKKNYEIKKKDISVLALHSRPARSEHAFFLSMIIALRSQPRGAGGRRAAATHMHVRIQCCLEFLKSVKNKIFKALLKSPFAFHLMTEKSGFYSECHMLYKINEEIRREITAVLL